MDRFYPAKVYSKSNIRHLPKDRASGIALHGLKEAVIEKRMARLLRQRKAWDIV
jgi:hypothetical protein